MFFYVKKGIVMTGRRKEHKLTLQNSTASLKVWSTHGVWHYSYVTG